MIFHGDGAFGRKEGVNGVIPYFCPKNEEGASIEGIFHMKVLEYIERLNSTHESIMLDPVIVP